MQKVIVAIFILFGLGAYSSTMAKPDLKKCIDEGVDCSFTCNDPKTESDCHKKCTKKLEECKKGNKIDIRASYPVGSSKIGSATVSGASSGTLLTPQPHIFGAEKMDEISGAAKGTMPAAVSRTNGASVTNSGVIPASGSAVTNTGVTIKRRAVVTGGAAGPFSAPGTAKAKVQ